MRTTVTVDFHSHILPGADHGSDGLGTSIKQLGIISSFGIKKVVATPHFYPTQDNVEVFIRRRNMCAAALRSHLPSGAPEVYIGAEVLVCEGMEDMDGIEKLAVEGTNCILLEMPSVKWSDRLFETVESIACSGLNVVIAHIDRYPPKQVNELLDCNVKAQLNPEAFIGMKNKKNSSRWLSEGCIAAVGSDLHRADEKRYNTFAAAVKRLGYHAEEVNESMNRILEGALSLNS